MAATAVLSCAAAALTATPAFATFPGANGKIAYTVEAQPLSANPGDIRTVDPDGANNVNLTGSNPFADRDPAWSPDGTKIAFSSRSTAGGPARIWTMNADGTGKTPVTTASATYDDLDPAWFSAGIQRIAFVRLPRDGSCSSLYVVDSDGANLTPLPPAAECRQADLDVAGGSLTMAYYAYDDAAGTHGLYVDSSSGPPHKIATDGSAPNWAPGGLWLSYSWTNGIFRTTPDGLHTEPLITPSGLEPAWSPDGTHIAKAGIDVYDDAGHNPTRITFQTSGATREPDWQPLPPLPPAPGHARPKAASPLVISLVPAYQPCAYFRRPNLTHGPPLAYGSCGPPEQESGFLTIGTADSNGAATQSVGTIRFATIPGDNGTAADEADVAVTASITDVRCISAGVACESGPLPDYTGAVRAKFSSFDEFADRMVITDKYNGGTSKESATASFPAYDPLFTVPIPCEPTTSTTIGSTCAVSTTLDAVLPGVVPEGKRSNWQLGLVQVEDGGDDGDPSTDGNTIFAAQGVFVP